MNFESIKLAANLNNQGVELLVSGHSSEAMRYFQGALAVLKEALQRDDTWSVVSVVSPSCNTGSSTKMPICESLSIPGLETKQCFIYDHGVYIVDALEAGSEDKIALYSTIVLFNLALVSHREGIFGQEKSLQTASNLYQMALNLLVQSAPPNEKSASELLTLLALNNKAQIHYEQCEYKECRDCFTEISKITGEENGAKCCLRYNDLEGILSNVLLLTWPSAAKAA